MSRDKKLNIPNNYGKFEQISANNIVNIKEIQTTAAQEIFCPFNVSSGQNSQKNGKAHERYDSFPSIDDSLLSRTQNMPVQEDPTYKKQSAEFELKPDNSKTELPAKRIRKRSNSSGRIPLQKGLTTDKAMLHKTATTPNDKALKAKTKLKTFQNKKSN